MCRAILVVGDCLAWNPVGDLAPARALLSEAGWLAVEQGWPHLAARAALTYGSLTRPGVIDPAATGLLGAVLEMGADDDWRPALAAIAASYEGENGARLDHERAIAEVEAAAAQIERCDPMGRVLVAEKRYWLHFGDADAEDRTLARDLRVAVDTVGGIRTLQSFVGTFSSSLRHGDRDEFDAAFAEFTLLVARTGLGQADVSMLETAVALLDGQIADAERLAFDAARDAPSRIGPRRERPGADRPHLGLDRSR